MDTSLYRSITNTSLDAIIIVDRTGNILECNDATVALYGYSRNEFLSLTLHDIEAEEGRDEIGAHMEKLLSSGYDRFETRHSRRDGSVIDIEVSVTYIPETQQFLSFCRDITERKRAEEQIRKISEVYLRFGADPIANINHLVELCGEMTGATCALYNRLQGDMLCSLGQWQTPPDFKAVDRPDGHLCYDVIRDGDSITVIRDLQTSSYGQTDPNVHLYQLQTYFGQPVKLANKNIGSLCVVFQRDVAADGHIANLMRIIASAISVEEERREAVEALRESEERFRSIMALSPDIISIIGADGRLLYNSPAALQIHGYTQEEMTGRDTFALIHPDDRDEVSRAFADVIRDPVHPRSVQYRYRNKDDSFTWMECSAISQLANPLINGVIAISRNIDARKHLEEERLHLEKQLQHTQKLESLGVLAGGIAHDFNNILTAIIGNAELARMRTTPGSPVVEHLQRIEKSAARAADLAQQMLAYSGKGQFLVVAVDLNHLLREMLHLLQAAISKKAVLNCKLAPQLPAVEADVTQMHQVIMNLVTNASESLGDEGGMITISTGCMQCDRILFADYRADRELPAGVYVYLEVTDTGCGMDAETMAKIFDPFFTTKFTGRGLGMAVVHGIVRSHKGAIEVSSKPGMGSTFRVLLPASEKPAQISAPEATSDSWRGAGTVLLVDDEETIREIGRDMLQELGFQVLTAADGRQALEQFRARADIAFVLLDLTMPNMDGEECFRELKQLQPAVKVIMSSGFSEEEIVPRFAGAGLTGFVQKPYTLSALRQAVRTLLGN